MVVFGPKVKSLRDKSGDIRFALYMFKGLITAPGDNYRCFEVLISGLQAPERGYLHTVLMIFLLYLYR